MLSANSSLISTNWPDLILSTILWGKGSAAGDSTNPAVGPGQVALAGVADQVTEVVPGGCSVVWKHPADVGPGRIMVIGGDVSSDDWQVCGGSHVVVLPLPVRRGTEAIAAGGGSAPSAGGAQEAAIKQQRPRDKHHLTRG